mgnify:CR=1 FL=1
MPTKFLIIETPKFQLSPNLGVEHERIDIANFPTRLQQHLESAKTGSTDMLFILAPEELRMQSAYAEAISGQAPVSVALFAMAIQSLGHKAVSLTGAQIGIRTDSTHTKARIRSTSARPGCSIGISWARSPGFSGT